LAPDVPQSVRSRKAVRSRQAVHTLQSRRPASGAPCKAVTPQAVRSRSQGTYE